MGCYSLSGTLGASELNFLHDWNRSSSLQAPEELRELAAPEGITIADQIVEQPETESLTQIRQFATSQRSEVTMVSL